ncbi:MAG TPA: transglutaminase-like domain-containing protein [Candidatus Kapabacteria bacterium]|nr:transglutaminase-like domain-containing protein [Candidatus Kapabacteria bacterium]
MTSDPELPSLLALLDDPDASVASAVEERLRLHGAGIVRPLFEFADTSSDTLACERARAIAREMNEELLIEEYRTLRTKIEEKRRGMLEEGAFLIARYHYPMLDTEYYKSELDALAGMLHDRIKGIHSPVELLGAVNEFFFKTRGFSGNRQNFLESDNSYLNQVIDRRLGIPISLSVLYILIAANRLGLPFTGASTPGHFLIRYDGSAEPLFIDAFNGGVILREEDIRRFLYTSGMPFYDTFLLPASARQILLRMLRNLIILFEEQKDTASKNAFERFHDILLGSSPRAVDEEEKFTDEEE